MLVLTRKVGEKLMINLDEIGITILEINGNQAKIGITAAKNISIHRSEVYDKIKLATQKQLKN